MCVCSSVLLPRLLGLRVCVCVCVCIEVIEEEQQQLPGGSTLMFLWDSFSFCLVSRNLEE